VFIASLVFLTLVGGVGFLWRFALGLVIGAALLLILLVFAAHAITVVLPN